MEIKKPTRATARIVPTAMPALAPVDNPLLVLALTNGVAEDDGELDWDPGLAVVPPTWIAPPAEDDELDPVGLPAALLDVAELDWLDEDTELGVDEVEEDLDSGFALVVEAAAGLGIEEVVACAAWIVVKAMELANAGSPK
jgi:hypothetical protein